MAEISSKAAMAAVTPKATADKSQCSGDGVGGLGGFSSLPSSIHHGLSEKLQGLTEKLHQLGSKNADSDSITRSRTSSCGANNHPSLAVNVQLKESAAAGAASAGGSGSGQPLSPSHTCSRTSSKKSNQSTLLSNGKITDGMYLLCIYGPELLQYD